MRRILVLGGYGTFGSRIVRLLTARKRWEIIVAGRSEAAAETFVRSLGGAQVSAVTLDRDRLDAAALRPLDLWLVIDASGPFQGEEARRYPLVQAAIEAGLHYIDIADALAFVRDITRLDLPAKAKGVAVIAGASSVPTLSSAVIAELAQGLDPLLEIETAISSSNQATLGRSVHAALLSYAGKPIRLRRFGIEREVPGLEDWQAIDIAVPGRPVLKGRLVAPCEVPDLALLPARYPSLRKVIFRAGTELAVLNRGAGFLARLVSARLLGSLSPLAGMAGRVFGLLHRFGTSRSGMTVTVTGRKGEAWERRRWNVVAEDGDGLWVPALASALLTEKLDLGEIAPGARPGIDVLSLAEFRSAFAQFKIADATEAETLGPSPFRYWLGQSVADLPQAIRTLHDDPLERSAAGTVTVTRGTNPIATLMCRFLGFPPNGENLPLTVEFEPRGEGEIWRRVFPASTFRSHLRPWPGRGSHVKECVGPLAYGFAFVPAADALRMEFRGWWLCGVPLPRALGPLVEARMWEEHGGYRFSVDVAGLGIGRVIAYRGRLTLNPARA